MKPDRYNIKQSEPDWSGLTLDELRYARAMTRTRIDITRQIILLQGRQIFEGQFSGTGSRSFIGRMFSALNYMDYTLIAMRFGSKIFKMLRKSR
ncbi:MAG: hypothetical protein K2H33_07005 [Muribaculaceae bacterium]|nr:hypothetical protein [Muribaculaceae bacterium]MDE5912988.1 hypothetical protein [Muribaculaceae bacterium]MDE5972798.1 hypothetical protein [Muribaculaceae bacterium]MDE6461418.1 hypothetical protein [Muribaculaceae bacterium]MDE7143790.1 hypothetical protein [Muribaculaceae bacterium]